MNAYHIYHNAKTTSVESGEGVVLPRPGSAGPVVILTTSSHTRGCPVLASPHLFSTFLPIAPCSRRKPVEMPSVGFGTLRSPMVPATGEPKRWSKGDKEVSEIRGLCFLLKVHEGWCILWIKDHYSLQDRLCMSLSFWPQELLPIPTTKIYSNNWSLSATHRLVHYIPPSPASSQAFPLV